MTDTKPYSPENIGARLRWFRSDFKKMKQEPFALSIDLNTASSLSQYETGKQRLPIDIAITIAEVHGVTLDFLYFNRRDSLSAEMTEALVDFDRKRSEMDNTK